MKLFLGFLGIVTNFPCGFGQKTSGRPWIKATRRHFGAGGLCRQTETHTKTRLGELVSALKNKQNLCIFTGRERHKQVNWVLESPFSLSLSLSLYLSIVFVCLYSWCCNHGFFPEDYLWCALFLYEMIWYIFLSLFSCFLFFLFLWQYLCMWLSHYAPKQLRSCNCLLDCGRGTNIIYILVI